MKVYLACLITLVCIATSFASPCPKDEFKNKISSIGFKDTSSVAQAAEELIKHAKNQEDKCREELLFIFRQYYLNCLKEYNNRIDSLGINETNEDKINKSLLTIGWCVKFTEGLYYIGESPGWFGTKFKKVLTDPYKEYLHFRSREIREGFSEDAILLISWDQLRHRIITWESFLNKYPNFAEKQSIQEYLDIYIRVFLTGMDNSRIDDRENMTLHNDVRAAYEKFIRENKASKYHKVVKDYYEMIKENNFIVPKNAYEYLKNQGYKSYLATQPPTY
jgi:hypothetical protein